MAIIIDRDGNYSSPYHHIETKNIHISEDHYNELIEDQKLLNALKTSIKRLTL